jgi:hypothetical protein
MTANSKGTGIGCGVEPVLHRRLGSGDCGGGVSSAIRREDEQICFGWQECGTNEKALRPEPEGLHTPQSVRRLARLGSRFRAGHWWCISFRAAEPAHGVRANAPEDAALRGLGLFGLAVLALVLRTDEQAIDEDVIALVEGFRDRLTKAVENHDAVPLRLGLPFVFRVFPRLLRCDGQNREVRSVAADLPLLRIFSEEADELNVIEIHFVSPFLPHFLGAAKGGEDAAPKASGCIPGGTRTNQREEPGKQKTRRCRAQELTRSRAQGKERQNRSMVRITRSAWQISSVRF